MWPALAEADPMEDRNAETQRPQRSAEGFEAKINRPLHENEISGLIIGAAIEVHRFYGPGLVEQIYEESLCHEFSLRGIPFIRI